ncbi:MAG: prephenate dehydrogenase/arogenate dehydrogenase family protein [Pirellulaceae bacterium]|nr:prephenate dehydrogenase/arogenate dehydrogenase family protein [Planctomycetales bacterium]
MMRWNCVAIVGVGLIGGSIGKALLHRKLARKVVGIGRDEGRLAAAEADGAITDWTTDVETGVGEAELAVVCTPVDMVADFVRRVASGMQQGGLITDAASTKRSIVALAASDASVGRMDGVTFIGSHPLAGSHASGCLHGREDLFLDRTVVVTPTEATPEDDRRRIIAFWQSLGAVVRTMSPDEHDRALAATSHLPHLVAAALAGVTEVQFRGLVGSGWLDSTRIAAGSVDVWEQILLDNRDYVLKALAKFATVLDSFQQALRDEDRAMLVDLLATGKKQRETLGN